MDISKASCSSSITVESFNDSGLSLSTAGTVALSDNEDDLTAVNRRRNSNPSAKDSTSVSTCALSSTPAKAGGSSTRLGLGGFLAGIFRSNSPTSTSTSTSRECAGPKNDQQAPSPIGHVDDELYPKGDDVQCTALTSAEVVSAPPPAPPRRAVSTGKSASGRKSSLRIIAANSKMTRRHSVSDSNLCRMRAGTQMTTSSIINGASDGFGEKMSQNMAQYMPPASTISNMNRTQTRRSSLRQTQTNTTLRRAVSRSISMPSLRRISFNKSVGFATIPSIDELSRSMHGKLYTSDDEYSAISRQRDTEIGILRARALSPFRTSVGISNINQDNDETEVEDSLACDWGLEHHLLPPPERLARANKIRKTIAAVLNEQETQRVLADLHGTVYRAYDAVGISTISMKCSQEARIRALERARQVEREIKDTTMRRKSDSVLEVKSSSWSSSDEDVSVCDGNAYHQQSGEVAIPSSSPSRRKMGRKSKSAKTSSKTAKMKRGE